MPISANAILTRELNMSVVFAAHRTDPNHVCIAHVEMNERTAGETMPELCIYLFFDDTLCCTCTMCVP